MTSTKKICRLCLDETSDDFEVLDECRAGMLKIIRLDLDLSVTDTPLGCSKCLDTLQQAFDFKTTCLENEDYLKTFRHSDSSIKLILEEIIQRNAAVDEIKYEEESVCRFCLKYFDSASFVKLNNIDGDIFLKDMLHKSLPEIDLAITQLPLMCYDCMENVQSQFNFIIAGLDNDEKIKNYVLANGINNNDEVDLVDVLKFVNDTKDDKTNLDFIKLEHGNLDGTSCDVMVKSEELCVGEDEYHVKIEDNFILETGNGVEMDRIDESGQPFAASNVDPNSVYACKECSHKTNRRDSLELHYLTHRTMSSSELIKCEKCDFRTKWRSSLTQHLLRHIDPSDIVKYKCAHCPYESKYKKHLRRHCKRHVNFEWKPYQCHYCDVKTDDKGYFRQHNKTKHNKVVMFTHNSFSCNKCDFETTYKSELSKHQEQAHKIVRYKCHCGYGSQRLYHFKEHSLKHKNNDEVVMFKCDICDFQTKYRKSYKTHVDLHKEGKMPQKRRKKAKKLS